MQNCTLAKKCCAIVATYNGKQWYDRCFGSLLRADYPLEIVAVDNSSDNSRDYIAKNFPAVKLIRAPEKIGFGKANNIGIQYALDRGADFFFLLNQDADIEPDAIGKMIAAMRANPDYGILSPVHLDYENADQFETSFRHLFTRICPPAIENFIFRRDSAVCEIDFALAALWLVSRQCIETLGGFNCELFPHYGEDCEYLYRAQYHGIKAGIVPFARGSHYHQNTTAHTPDKFKKRSNDKIIALSAVIDGVNLKQNLYRVGLKSLCKAVFCALLLNRRIATEHWLKVKSLVKNFRKIAAARKIGAQISGGGLFEYAGNPGNNSRECA